MTNKFIIPLSTLAVSDVREKFDEFGIVLIKNSNLDAQSFESFTLSFSNNFHIPATRKSNTLGLGDGYTTEVLKNNFYLLAHSEGAYLPTPTMPDICFFMCITPPISSGGATTLVHGPSMFNAIPHQLREKLRQLGIIYESLWEKERWQAEFGIKTESQLRKFLQQLPNVTYSLQNTTLHIRIKASAFKKTNKNQESFANGILTHLPSIPNDRYAKLPVYIKPTNMVYFGDGTVIDDNSVRELIDAHDACLHEHYWDTGDILVLDNSRYMHGRIATKTECERVILSRFCSLDMAKS